MVSYPSSTDMRKIFQKTVFHFQYYSLRKSRIKDIGSMVYM